MSELPLVSIITPCYNGESYVHRLLESILKQTYKRIELIFINDGSTDKTEEIVLSYKERLESRGIEFTYIYQENAGQAAAVNKGLKVFKGDYLTWPDSDDWLTTDSIEKRVEYLERNPEYGFVMCRVAVVNEANIDEMVATLYRQDVHISNLFDDFLTERDVYYAPIGYMARSRDFLDAIPTRDIYEGRGGQNWQMLLPLSYRYKCGYMDEILCFYLTRDISHSRNAKTEQERLDRCDVHRDILSHTLSKICMDSEARQHYASVVEERYVMRRFEIAFAYQDKELLVNTYRQLKSKKKATLKIFLMSIIGRSKILYWVYKKIRK